MQVRQSQVVSVCCEHSAARGVRVGMSLAQARSMLAGDVWMQGHDTAADDRALDQLAKWAVRFSPTVTADPPDGLLLDLAGCEKLFGSEERHVRQIDDAFARLRIPVRLTVAETFAGARAIARYGPQRIAFIPPGRIREALAPLPIAALDLDMAVRAALHEVGIETIEELLRLPREELSVRFGRRLLQSIDDALGARSAFVESVHEDHPLSVVRNFDGPIRRYDVIEQTLRQGLDRLLPLLESRGRGVTTLVIEFQRIHLDSERIVLTLTYPSVNRRHLWTLIGPRWERVHLGHGVEAVRLTAARTARLVQRQLPLEGGWTPEDAPRNDASLGILLDRLTDRLGPNGVNQIIPQPRYLPEQAYRFAPAELRKSRIDQPKPKPARSKKKSHLQDDRQIHEAMRPTLLFDPPEHAQAVALFPDGPPSQLTWRGRNFRVQAVEGVEQITAPWWQAGESSRHETTPRDYFIVHDDRGQYLWVYRVRSQKEGSSEWYIQGMWA
jgi:protein ImuB